ncbi:hypothetical protein KIN20_034002 [Parelaphostrongylus tenuis]|uniref:Uncharacterized protein n=1 Tax=Parelaphostrongylus tenuis TaxID=148309 RepID=A0AAD5RBL2_PARTN|nr:hypothetical protein KIN20_034002 [Parelaphostrongylus tenuis]
MRTSTNMARFPTFLILLISISVVLGCGVMPQGQATTRNFTVSGFTLPVAMVFTSAPSALLSSLVFLLHQMQLNHSYLVL